VSGGGAPTPFPDSWGRTSRVGGLAGYEPPDSLGSGWACGPWDRRGSAGAAGWAKLLEAGTATCSASRCWLAARFGCAGPGPAPACAEASAACSPPASAARAQAAQPCSAAGNDTSSGSNRSNVAPRPSPRSFSRKPAAAITCTDSTGRRLDRVRPALRAGVGHPSRRLVLFRQQPPSAQPNPVPPKKLSREGCPTPAPAHGQPPPCRYSPSPFWQPHANTSWS
jgi:hypothetical protein